MKSFSRQRRAPGFTLVEVLVVVGIIVILLSILFPTFARVNEAANRVTCMNNLKQIGNCIQYYASAQNGYVPNDMPTFNPAWDQGSPPWPLGEFWNGTGAWDYWQVSYLFAQCGATPALFVCPSSNMMTTYPEFIGTQHPSSNVQFSWLVSNTEWCWISNNVYEYPLTYQYYGAVCGYSYNTAGAQISSSPGGAAVMPPSPWGRVTSGTTTYYGSQTQWPAGTNTYYTVNLRPADLTNPPLMSDLCMTIPASWNWGDNKKSNTYFSHGTQLNGSVSNVLYSDFSVSADTISSASPFVSDTQWASAALPICHYR